MTCKDCTNKYKQGHEFWEKAAKAIEKAVQTVSCTRRDNEMNPICALCVRGKCCWSDCDGYDCFEFDQNLFLETTQREMDNERRN
jgi:hypothetical protein